MYIALLGATGKEGRKRRRQQHEKHTGQFGHQSSKTESWILLKILRTHAWRIAVAERVFSAFAFSKLCIFTTRVEYKANADKRISVDGSLLVVRAEFCG